MHIKHKMNACRSLSQTFTFSKTFYMPFDFSLYCFISHSSYSENYFFNSSCCYKVSWSLNYITVSACLKNFFIWMPNVKDLLSIWGGIFFLVNGKREAYLKQMFSQFIFYHMQQDHSCSKAFLTVTTKLSLQYGVFASGSGKIVALFWFLTEKKFIRPKATLAVSWVDDIRKVGYLICKTSLLWKCT